MMGINALLDFFGAGPGAGLVSVSLAAMGVWAVADCLPQSDHANPDKALIGDFRRGRRRCDTRVFMATPFAGMWAVQICVRHPCMYFVNKATDAPPCLG